LNQYIAQTAAVLALPVREQELTVITNSNQALMRRGKNHLEPPGALPGAGKIGGRTSTLLVVDDDHTVRELEAEILLQEGYSVLQAESAAEALRLAREADEIHLLITDFSMPEVDGLELSHRFRAMHPKTPVLMVSGSLPALRDGNRDLDNARLLAKPFTFLELLHMVRLLLHSAAVPLSRAKQSRSD
jgi:DNA-binding response OmpR family regulator